MFDNYTSEIGLKTWIDLKLILEKFTEQGKISFTLNKVSQAMVTDTGRFGTLLQADTLRECS